MQKIVVNNFGPIKHAEIELRNFVLLIGEQASGKSTIAKLVYFFNSLSDDFISTASNADTNDLTTILNQLSKATSQKFVKYFGHPAFLPEFKIQFYFSSEDDKWVKLFLEKRSSNNTVLQTTYSKSFIDTYNKQFDLLVEKFKSTSPEVIKIYNDDSEEVKRQKNILQLLMVKEAGLNIYSLRPDSIYFPASRNISVQYSDLFRQTFYGAIVSKLDEGRQTLFNMSDSILMREFLDHVATLKDFISGHSTFENAWESFKKAGTMPNLNENIIEVFLKGYQSILRGKYVINGGERIYFGEGTNNSIPVEQASSGQQESLRILQDIFSILVDHLNAFRVIEEPEAHLFPDAQKNLLELLALVINETPSQLFITTHSPYVLSVLSNLLYAKKVHDLGAATVEEIEEKSGMHRKTWLNKDQFAAYTMDNGKAKSIFDRDNTGLIHQNYLDQVSEDLGREFQVLHNLRLQQIRKEKQA